MSEFATTIRAGRQAKRLSLQQLGRQIGVSKQYLFRIESGEATPTPALCAQLARHLGLNPDALLLLAGHTPPDVLTLLQKHPQTGCALVRRELSKIQTPVN